MEQRSLLRSSVFFPVCPAFNKILPAPAQSQAHKCFLQGEGEGTGPVGTSPSFHLHKSSAEAGGPGFFKTLAKQSSLACSLMLQGHKEHLRVHLPLHEAGRKKGKGKPCMPGLLRGRRPRARAHTFNSHTSCLESLGISRSSASQNS